MIYIQVEERIYKARTFKTLVKKMFDTSFDEAINKKMWMFDVKARVKVIYNKHIGSKNFEKFILDLDEIGLIKLFRCGDCEHFNESPRKCLKGIEVFRKDMVQCPKMMTKEIRTFITY